MAEMVRSAPMATRLGVDACLLAHIDEVQEIHAQLVRLGYTGTQLRRLVSEQGARRVAGRPDGIESVDVTVPGAECDIPARIYRRRDGGPARLLMYFHGGGWVTGSIDTHDALCARIAWRTGHVVASVGYRLAPENPHPAANDDAIAATRWMLRHGSRYGATDTHGWAMGGDSAGAHLAVACTMQLREQAFPTCDCLLLFYPPVAPGLSTESREHYRHGPGLTLGAMEAFWQAYAGSEAGIAQDRRLDLRSRPDLGALPPCVLMTAEHDILRDEGEAFARLLNRKGVDVRCLRADGMTHGFARMLNASARARQHVDAACESLLAIHAFTLGKSARSG